MNEPNSPGPALGPSDLALALRQSIEAHFLPLQLDPSDPEQRAELLLWGRPWGIREISPHPHRFDEVVAVCKAVQERFLLAQVERLEACGSVWTRQHVLRIFWRDRRGRERLRRTVGLHRCKQASCPSCGKSRQAQLSEEVEKLLLLARDFGLEASHARLVTLTVPNGESIPLLRQQAHQGFAQLQRTRWWNRQAFGWVRGTEVVTGQDGAWNLHVHLLALFWSPKVSYQQLGQAWTRALGGPRTRGQNYVVDCESLEAHRGRRGSLLRAARYITKYLTKAEELKALMGGPGGLAHLVGSTRGLRKFAVGGGCSLLRRAAGILLPRRAFSAEDALAGTWLHEGRSPWRVEAVDPDTGEVVEIDPERLRDHRQEALAVWGEQTRCRGPTRGFLDAWWGCPAGRGESSGRWGSCPSLDRVRP